MLSLTDFLKLLPGVAPIKSRAAILAPDSVIGVVAASDLHRVVRAIVYGPTIEVGPDAAEAILAAYVAGRLPMRAGASPGAAPGAVAYVARREALVATIDERERVASATADMSLLRESDIENHGLMNVVFLRHAGKGDASLTIAGIPVSKTVAAYRSNSGKNVGWGTSFRWVGSDGQVRSSTYQPPEASNRRNDAARDWGMPE